LRLLDRATGASAADGWFAKPGGYLRGTGTLQAVLDARSFITDEYLSRISDTPRLRAFAMAEP